jgi:uncharacterized protein (DUF488 family)
MNSMITTIGHSTHPIKEFIEILKAHHIQTLVDVRTIPRSRFNPQFNQTTLAKNLHKESITYVHFPELGGLRRTSKESINTAWRNLSFRGYADYMQTPNFVHAIGKLLKTAKGENIAVMCAEGNPFRCHRSLIADALIVRKKAVWEISGKKSKKKRHLTSFARVKGTKITYPSHQNKVYDL